MGEGGQTEAIEHFRGFMPGGFLSYQQETVLNIWNRKPHRIYLFKVHVHVQVVYPLSLHNKIVKKKNETWIPGGQELF